MTSEPDLDPAAMRKLISRTAFYLVVLALLLFGAAGTLRWSAAWVYLPSPPSSASAAGCGLPATTPPCSPNASNP